MLVVMALGGNALLRRGERPDPEVQAANVRRAAQAVAEIARDHAVVVTHGNGPQVGLLALQAAALEGGPHAPLDQLDAESEGLIGYLIEREIANALPGRDAATLLTMVEVAPDDPAFGHPTKPIGPRYTAIEAARLKTERGWRFAAEGDKQRRVVPSPVPQRIVELDTIRLLVRDGVIVVCAGGGGIPVMRTQHGALRGIEAVIDKDRAAALLAADLGADALLLLTDVDAVYESWGTSDARPLSRLTPDDVTRLHLPAGSMAPKVEAALAYAKATRGLAAIGAIEAAARILDGRAGTAISAA
jgi:carbamate kinase